MLVRLSGLVSESAWDSVARRTCDRKGSIHPVLAEATSTLETPARTGFLVRKSADRKVGVFELTVEGDSDTHRKVRWLRQISQKPSFATARRDVCAKAE